MGGLFLKSFLALYFPPPLSRFLRNHPVRTKTRIESRRSFHPSTLSSIRSSTYLCHAPSNQSSIRQDQESRFIQNSKIALIVYVFYLFLFFSFLFSLFSLSFFCFSFYLLLLSLKHTSAQKLYPPTPNSSILLPTVLIFVVSITRLSIVISCAHVSFIYSIPPLQLLSFSSFCVLSFCRTTQTNHSIHPSIQSCFAASPRLRSFSRNVIYLSIHLSIHRVAARFHAHTFLSDF